MRRSAALAAVLILASVFPSAAAASEVPLIPAWADWRYLDTGANEGADWRDPAYDDSWWDAGPAELGYGDGTERTVVASGPSGNVHITTYFRRSFDVYDPSVFTALTARMVRDDGAVVYLNGTEVWRSNMPPGTIDYRTTALSSVGGPDEESFFSASIDESLLVAGRNVLAVEIHQVDSASSDISFNFELIGTSSTEIVALIRGPYLQMGTAESVRIRWRTNSPTNSRVRYGTSVNNLNQTVDVSTSTTEHDVLVTGLSPSTRYYYSIGTSTQTLAGDTSHHFVTSHFTGSTAPARIWVLGDSGTADYSASSVRDAYLDYTGSTRTNLWLMLGDNAYDTGRDHEFQSAVFEMYPHMLRQSVLWPAIGNHDTAQSQNPPSSLPYFNIFTLPTGGEAGGTASGTEKYYSFDYGNIHFICLDSMSSNRSSTGPMMTWLRNDLESTSQQWVIAFWHHPPYSKGSHDSDSEIYLVEMRQNAVPILEEYGVDLVLTGHSHSYERSFLIDSHYGQASTFVSSMKKDGGNGRIDGTGPYKKGTLGMGPHEGAVYVVAGSSGQITPAPLNHPAMYVGMSNLGSLVLDVNGGRLDVKFLRENGVIADYFTIVKGSLPNAPSALSATAASSTSVNLSWTDNSTNEETFRIERCTGASCTSFTEIGQVSANQTNYTSAGLTANTTYRFRVRAANTNGLSGYTNIAGATPGACTAPAISAQPQSTSIVAGQSATLTVTASGTALSYQWYAGSTAINGQTGASLTVTPASTTTYFVRITNACGTVDSATATVTVQPCSYSVSPASFAFTPVAGNGSAAITTTSTCAWSASTSTPWITITGGASGTGNGTTTFTVTANSGAARNGSITVAGTIVPVTQECAAPAITTQPQSQTVISGQSATLSVVASGGTPFSYQWYAGATPIQGQTGSSITVTPSSTTTYKVRVTNPCGTVDSANATVTVQACSYTVSPPSFAFTPAAGNGSASVTTTSTCSWTATTATPWITITGGASGTGNGTVAFTVTANSGAARSGSITIAGTTIPVTQECLAPAITNQPQSTAITSGESATLSVTATGAVPLAYQWYAGSAPIDGATTSSLTVTPASTTSYFVRVTSPCGIVDSNTATVTVQACTLSVSPSSFAFSQAAGGGSLAVDTTGSCSWTAVSNDPWIVITGGASDRGKGTTTFTVTANEGGARNGSITIAGLVIPVTQECTAPAITSQPQGTTIIAGESATLSVAATGPAPLSYEWFAGATPIEGQTAAAITVSPSSTTTYRARVTSACGSIDSAEATVTVQPCAYSASPSSFAFSSAENGGSIALTTTSTCFWTATTTAPWITITGGSSGSGNGTVTFTVAANSGAARSGSIEIGGAVVPVTQECSLPSIGAHPQSATIVTGESATLSVTATSAAPLSYQWFAGTTPLQGETASSITVSPSSTRSYFVRITNACGSVDSNAATVTVQPCTYSFEPASFTFPSAGANGSLAITTTGTCSWTAATATPWITLTGATTGSGSGTVTFTIAANGGTARNGSITIAGTTIPVAQACATPTITTQPQSQTLITGESTTLTAAASGATPLSYQWYAGTTPLEGEVRSWITVTPSSTTTYRVRVTNSCGFVDSAEATVTVEPCAYEVSPLTFSFGPEFSTGIVTVETSHLCGWTSSTTTPWITITEGTDRSGDDVVVFDLDANSGAARTGAITVAGTVIPITQGCRPTAITSQPRSTTVTIGGSATLSVTATGPAPLTYQWFAGTEEISGETRSSITVTPSTTTTYRVRVTSACGPLDSEEATVTVQPCSYTVDPPLFTLPATSGNATATISTATTCSWSASTSTPWITITGGASGTGSGTTTFTFAANSGPERSGSITVAGRVIPVTQAEPPCDPPMITTQPQSTTMTTGSPATLAVTTSGTTPLTYQWYIGAKGDTTTPIAGATGASVTVTPSSTTRYWARITNACGSVDSAAATVTVTPCSYDLSPASFSFPAGGGNGTIAMTAQSTCGWSASTATPWITLTEGLSGSGNGQITFTVAPHSGTEPRSGSITIAGIVVPVSQSEPVAAEAPPTPGGVNARATLPTRITFSWTAVPGATSYEIQRHAAGGGFVVIGSSTTTSFNDDSVSNSAAYLYRVRAFNGSVPSAVSASDLALAFFFTDDPLVAGVTPIRAVHLSELRSAVNAVRALAGLSPASFTGSAVPGAVISASDIAELREALEQARLLLGMPSSRYTDTIAPGLRVRAIHFNELRTRMR